MEFANNKTEKPLEIYREEFGAADPAGIAARTGLTFNAEAGMFELRMLERVIHIFWPNMDMVYVGSDDAVPANVQILTACYLMHGRTVPSTGRFVSYHDIPSGEHYFKAFEGRCIKRLTYMFKSAEQFSAACRECGGTPTGEGDAGFEFEFIDGVFIRLAVWEADEEFGPAAQITFSDNTAFAFTAEELAAVGDILLGTLKRARK